MYVWSIDEIRFVNSERVTSFYISQSKADFTWAILADGIFLSAYETQEKAKEELRKLQTALEVGQESYRLG